MLKDEEEAKAKLEEANKGKALKDEALEEQMKAMSDPKKQRTIFRQKLN